MIKSIIFDMDGLMVDTERLYIETEYDMAKLFKKKLKKETIWRLMGRKPIESMKIFVEDLNIDLSAEKALQIRNNIMEYKMKTDLVPMKGLFDIINEFYGKLKLAIATGAEKNFLDITVDSLKIREKFDVLQSSEEIVEGKPSPEIYLKTIEKLNLKPEQCVVLEDSYNGCLAAKKAGCKIIAVKSKYTKGIDFSFCDYIAKDLIDAKNYIKKLI